jgi:hypothetical protein
VFYTQLFEADGIEAEVCFSAQFALSWCLYIYIYTCALNQEVLAAIFLPKGTGYSVKIQDPRTTPEGELIER